MFLEAGGDQITLALCSEGFHIIGNLGCGFLVDSASVSCGKVGERLDGECAPVGRFDKANFVAVDIVRC